jgi:hypothetical protein
MQSPVVREHIAFRYLSIGASVIPLQTRDKRPFIHILDGGSWSAYQQRLGRADEVQTWITRGAENWGIVCGTVSGRLCCGDVTISTSPTGCWTTLATRCSARRASSSRARARRTSGSAPQTRLHSGVWYLTNRAGHAGDIRGDGRERGPATWSCRPASIPGQAYRVRAGNFALLPDVPEGDAFLRAIGDAYLATNPQGNHEPTSNERTILQLSAPRRPTR